MSIDENFQTLTIQGWVNKFAELYKNVDFNRRTEDLWMATIAHCSEMGEGIRRVNYPDIMEYAAHTFSWMCSFINRLNKTNDLLFNCTNSFCDIVFLKFPEICGHCKKNPCQCDASKIDMQKDKAADYEELLERWKRRGDSRQLNQWIPMFKDIYGGRIHITNLESIGFHFLEEAGEETLAIRSLVQLEKVLNAKIDGVNEEFLEQMISIESLVQQYAKCTRDPSVKNVEEPRKIKIDYDSREPAQVKLRIAKAKMDLIIEFADTFSWFCAILIKLSQIAENSNLPLEHYDLEKTLQRVYKLDGDSPLTCPTCESQNCKCLFFQKAEVNNEENKKSTNKKIK